MDLSGIGQFVVDIDRRCILEELAEAGAGVGKAPTWGLDPEVIERLLNSLVLRIVHRERPGGKFETASKGGHGPAVCLHPILKFCLDMRKTGVMMLLSHQIVALRRATTIYRLVMNAPAIELVDIHKSFGSTRVLEGVSLSLLPGEVHSLMGENGAGKAPRSKS